MRGSFCREMCDESCVRGLVLLCGSMQKVELLHGWVVPAARAWEVFLKKAGVPRELGRSRSEGGVGEEERREETQSDTGRERGRGY